MIDRAEAEEALLIACHFPHHGHGQLIRLAGRRYWQGGMEAGPERGPGSPEP